MQTTPEEPRVLAGKYRLEAKLRSGAMGAIYRAHHLTLDKAVCIKIMHPEHAKDEQLARRFHREARAASRFDHPSSILILDHGSDADGTLFIAMELVDGRDLFEMIEEANTSPGGIGEVFPPRRIVDLLSQTLGALAAAHEVGVLHRDLKPENIMVTSSWDDGERVKVCDFGIAHMEEAPETGCRITRHGFILGTPEYMSPEQARAASLDARSEVYAVGMILYHLLTGRVPFEDESPIVVALMQINETPKRPSELNPSVNPRLEAVCLKAIEKDPAHRYPTARAMRTALRDAVARPSSMPVVQVAEAPPPRSRARFVAVAALLVSSALGVTWKLGRAPVIATASAAAPSRTDAVAPSAAPVAVPQPVEEPVRSRLDACYRAALPRASSADGTATLRLETDDVGAIRRATVTGPLANELSPCISKVPR